MRRRFTQNELLFLSVFLLSVMSLVATAVQILDSHKTTAYFLLGGSFALTIFVAYILYSSNPRIRKI